MRKSELRSKKIKFLCVVSLELIALPKKGAASVQR